MKIEQRRTSREVRSYFPNSEAKDQVAAESIRTSDSCTTTRASALTKDRKIESLNTYGHQTGHDNEDGIPKLLGCLVETYFIQRDLF